MDKDNKQLRKEKPFYKVWWYYLIIGVLLFGNIAVLVWMDDAVKPYWLTLISGWVSFIATITIGVIAYNQSERYKNENTRYEKAQEDRAWCQDKYIAINLYRERMNKFYLEFIDNSPIDIIEKYYQDIISNKFSMKTAIVAAKLNNMHSNIVKGMVMKEYYFSEEQSLADSFIDYKEAMNNIMDEVQQIIENNDASKIVNVQNKYDKVLSTFNLHFSSIDRFVSKIVLSGKRELLEKELKEMNEQQIKWALPIIES